MVKRTSIFVLLLMVWVLPAAAQPSLPANHKLDLTRIGHIYQNMNDCSGATLTMGLSYFGYPAAAFGDQEPARRYLKPDAGDQNVSPWQIVDYVNLQAGQEYNVRALARRGGDPDLLRALIASDFPVIIEKGFMHYDDVYDPWMGHYLLMVGYDDAAQIFYTYDSFLGHGNLQGRQESYSYIQEMWRQFNHTFIVLYPPERESEVQSILGRLWDERAGWERAKERAQLEAASDPADGWAWFNLGEAATALGEYDVATIAFRQALDNPNMPPRLLWYQHGAFEAFYQAGQYDTVINLAQNLRLITKLIEEFDYYEGLALAAKGETDAAQRFLNGVLRFNPNFYPAQEALIAIQNGSYQAPS